VVFKPASDTPLTGLKLVEILLEAGLPPQAINCLTGGGGAIGDQLCSDERVRKISFTGSRDVGEKITKIAGIKRVTLELGSNSPLVVLNDADPEKVAGAKLFQQITYRDVLHQDLKVMDSTAISLCMDNGMPIVVFSMNEYGNIKRVVMGERVGSTVRPA